MGAAGFGGSFAPIVQYEKWEIHPVFPHFSYFRLCQNLSPNLLAPLAAVMIGWALFYFEDFGALASFFARLFCSEASSEAVPLMLGYLPLMVVGIVAAAPWGKQAVQRFRDRAPVQAALLLAGTGLLMLCTAALVSQSYNPFIYFRF